MTKVSKPPALEAETREAVGIFHREAVGIFHDARGYGDAVEDLLRQGFSSQDLSILAGDGTAAEGRQKEMTEGRRKEKTEGGRKETAEGRREELTEGKQEKMMQDSLKEAEDDPAAPRRTLFPREVLGETIGAAIGLPFYLGATATTIILLALGHESSSAVAAAVVTGLLAAALGLTGAWVLMKPHDRDIRDTLAKRGGVVLWVQTRSPAQGEKAAKILRRHQASDVHIHALSTKT